MSEHGTGEETHAVFDFHEHLQCQHEWSERTFGPGRRTAGVVDHIRKELREIEAQPDDLEEWIDVVLLALDGAWRVGASPAQIIVALAAKFAKNVSRTWPDWRNAEPDKAIEHVRATMPMVCALGSHTGPCEPQPLCGCRWPGPDGSQYVCALPMYPMHSQHLTQLGLDNLAKGL